MILTSHSEADYYKLSTEKMKVFEGTLTAFSQTLKSRKLDIKYGIDIKDPKEYTMTDVLLITKKIYDEHESANSRGCMSVIRKCFQATVKHEGTLTNLLTFVPTDVYGSVLCGGFTLILGVSFHTAT